MPTPSIHDSATLPTFGDRPPGARRQGVRRQAVTSLLDKVRREAHGKLRSVTVVEEIVIGADRSMTSKRVIQTLIAVKEMDRQIAVHQGEPGCDITLITPRGLTGCRTGRVARDADAGALLGELLLDRTVNVLEIQFHRDAMPVRVDEFRRPHSSSPDTVHRELMMTHDGRVHVLAPSTDRGIIGITWEWD